MVRPGKSFAREGAALAEQIVRSALLTV